MSKKYGGEDRSKTAAAVHLICKPIFTLIDFKKKKHTCGYLQAHTLEL